jgi:hypothetical protein
MNPARQLNLIALPVWYDDGNTGEQHNISKVGLDSAAGRRNAGQFFRLSTRDLRHRRL